jgi:hypothetical protein
MNPLINDLVKSRHSCRKTILLVFFIFHPLASCADNEPTVIPGTIIKSIAVPGGLPPTEPPPTQSWLCDAGCTPQSIMEGHEKYLNQTGQKPRPGTRSITFTDASGNISSKGREDEK